MTNLAVATLKYHFCPLLNEDSPISERCKQTARFKLRRDRDCDEIFSVKEGSKSSRETEGKTGKQLLR